MSCCSTTRLFCLVFLISGIIGSQMYAQAPQSISLDGQWEIIFDHENEGREAGWMNTQTFEQHPDKQGIEVPAAWERYEADYEGVAFYRKSFEVPADWEGRIVRLQFGAVNYLSEIWLNEEVVGFHEGGFTPFEFRIDEIMKPGETNMLTMRVVGPLFLTDKEIDGMKALETPQWRGGISGGIWQSVQLVATGETYLKDVFLQPNIQDNTVTFHLEVDHTAIKGSTTDLHIQITEANNPETIVASLKETWQLRPGINQKSRTFKIEDAIYWSPDNPHLYRVVVQLIQAENASDEWTHRFGMRELTIKDKDFYLNGERIYLKASFFEGLYPNGIAHPDNEAMARREIQLAKEAGFNMIRPWRRPPVQWWLDLADEMGVLVVGSPALECMQLPFSTPYLPMRVENEVRKAILRDRNRTCVVQWELFNELHRPVLKQMMRPMAMLARDLDPTRLILDESGGWAYGANMYLPNQHEPTKFNDIHNYPGPFINRDRYEGYLSIGMTPEEKQAAGLRGRTPGRNVLPGLMSYVSELGYGSLPDLTVNNEQFAKEGNPLTPAYRYHKRIAEQQQATLQEMGFADLYPDMQQFYLDQQAIHGAANKRMIEAVRANPEVDGYCIHALVAGDWILGAGLLDLWRNPKSYAYEGTKAANQPRILSIRSKPRNVYASQGASLEILGINELEGVEGKLSIEIQSKKGRRVFRKVIDQNWEAGVSSLLRQQLNTEKWKGTYVISAKMLGTSGEVLAENSYEIDIFRERDLTLLKREISILEEGKLGPFLRAAELSVSAFSEATPASSLVLVEQALDDLKQEQRRQLVDFAQKGGTVAILGGVKDDILDSDGDFPFQTDVHPVVGLWTCIPHLVHDHPILAGLPTDQMMREVYENVWAMKGLRSVKPEGGGEVQTIVGSIGFDWFSREHKMHYSGPGDSWWGADVMEMEMGEGKWIVSQLRIVENLGEDPVADRILGNLIRYVK